MDKNEFNEKKIKEKLELHIERALTRIGMLVQGDAVLICPVDTGNLRNSIVYDVKNKEKSVVIGTNVEYALDVEKGSFKPKKAGKQIPFLTPAGERNKKNIETIVAKEMRDFK